MSRAATLLVMTLALVPMGANAQAPVAQQATGDAVSISFASLAGKLAVGQTIIVTDRVGRETKGRVEDLTATSLRLTVNGQRRDFAATEVRAIVAEKRATRRGALIGLGAGAGTGLALGVAAAASDRVLLVSGFFGGIGAGVGAAVGSAFVHRESLYDAALPGTPVPAAPRAPDAPLTQSSGPSLAKPRPDYKWAGSVALGTTSSGPGDDFEQAMRDAQFDENRGACFFGLCFPGTNHPASGSGFGYIGFPWHLNVRRRLSPWWGLGLSAGHAPIGEARGQKRDTLDFLDVSYRVTIVAPLFVVGPAQGFRAAAGPAFFSSTFRVMETGMEDAHRRVGFVTEFGLALPPRSRLFGELVAQYRHVGHVNAGPFTTRVSPLSGVGWTLPAASVDMNHWFVGLGAGVRF